MTSEFLKAVQQTPAVQGHGAQGLRALGAHAGVVRTKDPRRFTGSLALDAALVGARPYEARWDFGIGLRTGARESAHWIEVHPADTSNVGEVLAKLAWLRGWLRAQAPQLAKLTGQGSGACYHWVSTGRVRISADSPQSRALRRAGLNMPVTVLHLP